MAMYEEFPGRTPSTGVGCALYGKLPVETLFHIIVPLETVPSLAGAPETIEFDLTTSSVKGKIKGKMTIEDSETEFFAHRDNYNAIQKFVDAGSCEILVVNPDYTGWKAVAEFDYRQNEATSSDIAKSTLTIIPSYVDKKYIDNVYDLLMPTVKITSPVPETLELVAPSGTHDFSLITSPANATVSISYSSDGYADSGTSTIATASNSAGAVTITGKAQGSEVIKFKVSQEGYASWETFVHVVVKSAE